jgi:hypothetical protein
MKRWGIVLLVMVGFVSGIAFVYSCGGGGSGALAAVEAHFHDEITPGVFPIGASAFIGNNIYLAQWGQSLSPILGVGGEVRGHAAFTLPFKCTIVGIEAEVRNQSASSEVYIELHDGEYLNAISDTLVPIVSFDTSSEIPTSTHVVISTPTLSIEYDPTNLIRSPLWVTARFVGDYATTRQRMYWVKIYYTVP